MLAFRQGKINNFFMSMYYSVEITKHDDPDAEASFLIRPPISFLSSGAKQELVDTLRGLIKNRMGDNEDDDLDMDDEVNAAIVDPVGLGSTLQSSTSNGSNSDLSDTGAPMYGVAIVALLLIAGSIASRKIQTRDNSNKAS